MSDTAVQPLFVDTGAFYARLDEDDTHHEETRETFGAIRDGELPYRPLYTSLAVLSEFATLALYKLGHETAVRGLNAVRRSESFNVLVIDRPTFASAAEQFERFDDQEISFIDHTSSVLASEHAIEHVFGFDGDFQTLGLARVPVDTGRPNR